MESNKSDNQWNKAWGSNYKVYRERTNLMMYFNYGQFLDIQITSMASNSWI